MVMGPGAQTLTIIAQDPTVRGADDRILRAKAAIPAEELAAGPWGHRVQVIDYDRTRDLLYPPIAYEATAAGELIDPYEYASDETLLGDPQFHAQNVFAIAMRTLARFEQALGRRVSWGFGAAHQLKLVPHAFTDANAFYSRLDEALLFGCFPSRSAGGTVFTCLSHDVVAHEVAHALLDGIRSHFMSPSSPDQAAFHEACADLVSILSVFSLPGVVDAVLTRRSGSRQPAGKTRMAVAGAVRMRAPRSSDSAPERNRAEEVRPGSRAPATRSAGAHGPASASATGIDEGWLIDSVLLGLAEQMGGELDSSRVNALRRSASLPPDTGYLDRPEYIPAHRRGEILVAAVLRAFVDVWFDRLRGVARTTDGELDRARVAEEGEMIADQLLTMVIRALDYTPPIHLQFGDFLSALLTADAQVRPDDSRYRFRAHLRETFADYGIEPASDGHLPTLSPRQLALRAGLRGEDGVRRTASSAVEVSATPGEEGLWRRCSRLDLQYHRTHFEPLGREPDEVYRFLWENRVALQLYEGAHTRVLSVRPCLRVGPDGFVLRETVAEFVQLIRLTPAELRRMDIAVPAGVPEDVSITLYGGGTLIFDEFGRLQFYIHNSLDSARRQSERLAHLWEYTRFSTDVESQDFAMIHRLRSLESDRDPREEW
jgi:hypothetical protein